MILVLGHVIARPETAETIRQAGAEHVARSRLEPGCVTHAMAVDANDPLRFVFTEEWADMESLSAHFAVPESRAFGALMAELGAGPPSMAIYDASLLRRL